MLFSEIFPTVNISYGNWREDAFSSKILVRLGFLDEFEAMGNEFDPF